MEAKESSKDEECAAICKLRGVDATSAPIALQLKAIDEEYHHLVDSGQSGKSDHVMGLFVWKSKQASQVCNTKFHSNSVKLNIKKYRLFKQGKGVIVFCLFAVILKSIITKF
jgi:hypothetical protein